MRSKKLLQFFLNPIWGLFLGLTAFSLQGLAEDFIYTGQLVFDMELQQKPSAQSGHASFIINTAEWGLQKKFADEMDVKLQARYFYNFNQNKPAYATEFSEARLQLQKAFTESDKLEFGIVRHPWTVFEDLSWDFNFVYMNGRGLGARFAYIPRSDIGVSYHYLFDEAVGIHFSVTNGEGSAVAETGAKKDLALIANWSKDNWWMAAGYIFGGHENIDDSISKKTRELFLMRWQATSLISLQLEFMRAVDPVDAINKILADEVDMTAQGGQVATAEAASMGIHYHLSEESRWSLLLQGHWLNPMKESPDKWVRSAWIGVAHQTRKQLQTLISFQQTNYGSDHGAAIRDRESLVLTGAFNF